MVLGGACLSWPLHVQTIAEGVRKGKLARQHANHSHTIRIQRLVMAAISCPPAPWRASFLSHVSSMSSPTFVLSTLHAAKPEPRSPFPVVPRARTCIFRGLWGTLPVNDRNPAPRNPAIFESDLPVLTTDVRMEKGPEIINSAPPGPFLTEDSGGGGPVEAVWWAEGHSTQWRVRGTAWLLGPDIDGDGEGPRAVRDALHWRMRRTGNPGEDNSGPAEQEWSWSREVTGHFGNLSPAMRGTFRSPPPGQPVGLPAALGLGLGQTVEDLDDQVARRNFRVVVIVPDEVDQVDLSDQKNPKRWLYSFRGAANNPTQPGGQPVAEWESIEVWP